MHSAVPTVIRLIVGLLFTLFGLDGFFHFMPAPPPPPPAGGAFLGALAAAGYMFPLVKAIELTGGLLLLSNRFTALGIALLAPIVVNIVAFTLALHPANPVAYLVLVGELALVWCYRDSFRGLFAVRAVPAGGASASGPVSAAPSTAQ